MPNYISEQAKDCTHLSIQYVSIVIVSMLAFKQSAAVLHCRLLTDIKAVVAMISLHFLLFKGTKGG